MLLLKFIFLLTLFCILHLNESHMQLFNSSYPMPATTVERKETFSNGCYKQLLREPDLLNSTRFYETEQLICPPTVNATTVANLTQQLQNSTTAPKLLSSANHNTSLYLMPVLVNNQTAPFYLVPAIPNAVSSMTTQQNLGFSTTQKPMTTNTSQMIIISKKTVFYNTDKKRSSSNSFHNLNWFLSVIVVIFTILNL